jgi:hypothetical protein
MKKPAAQIITTILVSGIALMGAVAAKAASGPKFIKTPACVITQPSTVENEITCSAHVVGVANGVAWVDGVPEFRCNSDPTTVAFTGTGGSPLVPVTSGKPVTVHSQARYPSAARPDTPYCAGELWTFIAFRQTGVMALSDGVSYSSSVENVYPP